ncbi:UDP-glucosyltransferase 2-like [Chironomus tepperi]|uniref:UDP-glucosyltransferase 2-like n=1 Tax=Chironomus tepperi TaxID=113505 RepID=UPI00391EE5C6
MRLLLDEGHNITMFTTHPYDYGDHPNMTQYVFPESVKIHNQYTDMLMYKQKKMNYHQIILGHEVKAYYEASRKELEHPAIQDMIHNSSNYHFDLVMVECLVCPFFLMAEIFDCPIAFVGAIDPPNVLHSLIGNDVNPLKYSESTLLPFVHGKMSLYEMAQSVFFQFVYQEFIFNTYNSYKNVILRWEYFPHLGLKITQPPMDRYSLLILNTNHALGHVRAMMPHSIQVGFFHIEKPKKIEDLELKEYLDSSKTGVIIMVFGSTVNAKNLGTDVVKKFLNSFKTCNMSVLWKIEEIEEGIEVPSNVKIVSWLPLADALAHPNVKLLIFHGGIFSTYEAIDREVPMIVFPLSYDQPANANFLADKGVAMVLDLNNFDEAELSSAIKEMTKFKYVVNIRKLRAMAYNTPISSGDLIKWHVNNAIKHRITYAKDFGSMCFFGSPLYHFIAYFVVFISLLCYIIWKLLPKSQVKVTKVD